MKRREFVGKSAALGLAGALTPMIGGFDALAGRPAATGPADMAAVRGGDPVTMFNKAIEALGGMGRFVKAGQKVLVKPNIGWDTPVPFRRPSAPFMSTETESMCWPICPRRAKQLP